MVLGLFALAMPLLMFAAFSYYALIRRNRQSRTDTARERDQLTDRMNELTNALDRAASGDLGVTLPVDFDDEQLAALTSSFENTLARLRTLVAQAQAHSVQLSQAAGQLKATAVEQATSATEQSATVTETTATIEELAATAAQIAETAGSVSRVAQETLVLTGDGRGAVADAVGAMDSIASTVDGIAVSCGWGWGTRLVRLVGFWC